jgi:glycosyltransferase involved in cell wall biosynthesis
MGDIAPFVGEKNYAAANLLFVAKHLFEAKGGTLLVQAFERAQTMHPDLRLTIVADPDARKLIPNRPDITVLSQVSWGELNALFHKATLLVQPMLNDPWGQVYLESLIARTPILGLRRNGLPEILDNGANGFLIETPSPEELSAKILFALSDPLRLDAMGRSGQRKVMEHYSWDRVASRIAFQ